MAYLRIENTARQTVLCHRARRADSFGSRLRGLMFRRSLVPEDGLLLVPDWSIHTFFMRFPIDVLFLDTDWRVLSAYPSVPPWRVGPVHRGAYAVLELPPGTIARTNTHVGDSLSLQEIEQ
ncbi:hypothetical protein ARMA_2139 [Ardenticatena maritima]|uniref:DUF192 domain-containing protein n=1 Tax=Ardenticatena maritima TaxID=872965 RepID=A0A0M8KAM3_9CHLR|nr:DUF192 domain-containing protein [Ardenticatena maritima]KPL88242.1 hypothetical protein SE16_05185 [Ardenticatena maritima]GAP63716.1 hypothetical protein ARMA_2139 [Ardenticatena maritima]